MRKINFVFRKEFQSFHTKKLQKSSLLHAFKFSGFSISFLFSKQTRYNHQYPLTVVLALKIQFWHTISCFTPPNKHHCQLVSTQNWDVVLMPKDGDTSWDTVGSRSTPKRRSNLTLWRLGGSHIYGGCCFYWGFWLGFLWLGFWS